MLLDLVKSLNEIDETVWGIIILLFSLVLSMEGKDTMALQFFTAGTTMLGISAKKAVGQMLTRNPNSTEESK